jgi:hypothetical protein
VARVFGQALSLGLGGLLLHVFGNLPDAVGGLLLGPVAMVVIVAAWFPETHGRELEDINDEPGIGLALGPVPGAVPGPRSSPADLIEPLPGA